MGCPPRLSQYCHHRWQNRGRLLHWEDFLLSLDSNYFLRNQ